MVIKDMNGIYRFSPIKDEKTFWEVLTYITIELESLSKEVINQQLPVSTLKIFPHYTEEYSYLYDLISKMGSPAPFNSKTSFYVNVDKEIHGNKINSIGVRIVDPYRMQVGCGDYKVNNFPQLKEKYINNKSTFVREFKGSVEMLELWHSDIDVLGYVMATS